MDDLLQSLTLPAAQAREAWQRWRSATVIDALPYACHLLLPALNPRLHAWLVGDPASGILQGIVRQVWTQNQLRLRACAGVVRALQEADIDAAVAGPPAWAMAAPPPAIRAIPYLKLLTGRTNIEGAIEVLQREGWRTDVVLERAAPFDRFDHVCFSKDSLQLYLHWRLIPVPPYDAAECETVMAAGLRRLNWNRQEFHTPSLEATLLEMVCAPRPGDLFPWEADLALLNQFAVDWKAFRRLAVRFAPDALDRLGRSPATPMELKIREICGNYREFNYARSESPGVPGFLRFLAVQWRVSSLWLLPLAAVGRALKHGRRLSR